MFQNFVTKFAVDREIFVLLCIADAAQQIVCHWLSILAVHKAVRSIFELKFRISIFFAKGKQTNQNKSASHLSKSQQT